MSDIERWSGTDDWGLSRSSRDERKGVEALIRETRMAGYQVDAEASLAARIMERVVDVDRHRKSVAGMDEDINAALLRIELNFIDKVARRQRGFGSVMPL